MDHIPTMKVVHVSNIGLGAQAALHFLKGLSPKNIKQICVRPYRSSSSTPTYAWMEFERSSDAKSFMNNTAWLSVAFSNKKELKPFSRKMPINCASWSKKENFIVSKKTDDTLSKILKKYGLSQLGKPLSDEEIDYEAIKIIHEQNMHSSIPNLTGEQVILLKVALNHLFRPN